MPVISARFTGSKLVGRDFQLWVQLVNEFGAPLRLVGLADRLCSCTEPVERTQKSSIGLVAPAHVARAAPSRLSQAVEPAVIADAEVCVRLDVVASEPSELRPRIAIAGPARADVGNGVAATRGRHCERAAQRFERVVGFGRQDGFRDPAGGEADVGHAAGWYGTGLRYR